jgi:hypothetical protein
MNDLYEYHGEDSAFEWKFKGGEERVYKKDQASHKGDSDINN